MRLYYIFFLSIFYTVLFFCRLYQTEPFISISLQTDNKHEQKKNYVLLGELIIVIEIGKKKSK